MPSDLTTDHLRARNLWLAEKLLGWPVIDTSDGIECDSLDDLPYPHIAHDEGVGGADSVDFLVMARDDLGPGRIVPEWGPHTEQGLPLAFRLLGAFANAPTNGHYHILPEWVAVYVDADRVQADIAPEPPDTLGARTAAAICEALAQATGWEATQ